MAPIQIVLLLILARLPATLTPRVQAATQPFSDSSLAITIIFSYLTSHLLLVLFIAARGKSAIRQLHSTTVSAAAIASHFERLLPYARWATILFAAIHLYFPHGRNLPAVIRPAIESTQLIKHVPLMAEALYLAPPLLAWIVFWVVQYFVEAAHRERSLPYRLASQLPAHDMPSLSQFLSMQIRHNFYLLAPILIVTLLEHFAQIAEPNFPHAPYVAVVASLLVFMLMTPWLITRVWATVPLAGPLRHRLDGAAAHYRLRFKNILVWKTHNAVTNAAILGYLPFSRYFLMTDALLETLTDQQLEAVFAHEVGHGYHRHLWWYFAGLIGAIVFTWAAAELIAPHMPLLIVHMFDQSPLIGEMQEFGNTSMILSLVLLLPFILLGFPYVSHRFEHQADWFAARHMAYRLRKHPQAMPMPAAVLVAPPPETAVPEAFEAPGQETQPVPAEPVHVPAAAPAVAAETAFHQPPEPPTPAGGAEVFISSLEAIVDLAHRSRNHRGWMHPSINHRILLLRQLAMDPLMQKAFDRRQKTTRLMIVAFLVITAAMATWTGFSLARVNAEPPASTAPRGLLH